MDRSWWRSKQGILLCCIASCLIIYASADPAPSFSVHSSSRSAARSATRQADDSPPVILREATALGGLPNRTLTFWHISAHASPSSDLIWILRNLLDRDVEPTYCLRTWKGCSSDFPGELKCCHDPSLNFPHKHEFLNNGTFFRQGRSGSVWQ